MARTPPTFPSRSLLARLALPGVLVLAGLALPLAAAAPLAALAPSSSLLAVQLTRGAGSYPGLTADLSALPTKAASATLRSVLTELQAAAARGSAASDRQVATLLGAAAELLRTGGSGRAVASACPALGSTALRHPHEVLLALSATGYAPAPALLLLARPAPGDANAAQAASDVLSGCFGRGRPLTQDGTAMQPLEIGGHALALARVGDVVAVATSVDLLRATVRLGHGSSEPSLAGQLPADIPALSGDGVGVVVDTQAVASMLGSLPGLDADPTIRAARSHLEAALHTVPLIAAHFSLSPDGIAVTNWTRVDPTGGDAELAALVRCQGCRARPSLLTPASAVAVDAMPLRLQASVHYLSGLVQELSAVKGTKIDPLAVLKQRTGLDLQKDLFPWLGNVVTSVRLPAPAGTPGAVPGGLAQVTIVPVSSVEAASSGLAHLGQALEQLLARAPGMGKELAGLRPDTLVASRTEHYRGVDITRIQVGPATDIGVALVGGRLVIAVPSAAMHTVVDTYRGGKSYYDGPLARALSKAPADAQSVLAANAPVVLHGTATMLRTFSQPLAFVIQTALLAARHASPPGQASAAPAPPTMTAMLTMAELPSDALDAVAGHLGVARGWVVWRGGVLERHWLVPIH